MGQPSSTIQDTLSWDDAPRGGWTLSVAGAKHAYRTIRQAAAAPAAFVFVAFLLHGHFAASRGWVEMFGPSSATDAFFAGFSFAALLGVGALLTASTLWMGFASWDLYKMVRHGSAVRQSIFTAGIALLATSVIMLGAASI